MGAVSTGLTKYTDRNGAVIFAAKITEITPFTPSGAPPGSATLKFGEFGSKKANLIGSWIAQHNPEVGGYFVCYDLTDGQTLCRYESASHIAQNYTKAVQS